MHPSMRAQSGNVLIIILIAVSLFAALVYAFTQGSRTNVGFVQDEMAKATTTQSNSYNQAINAAIKRLKLRGCSDAQLSYETPNGNNMNAAAPTDGRCHIFRTTGGGVQFQGTDTADACLTGGVGTPCSDGAIYAGSSGGYRIYIANADEGALMMKVSNTATSGTASSTDGKANTDAMLAASAANHPAANACNNRPPAGTWYVPAVNELNTIWTNRADINLSARGFNTTDPTLGWYWTSTQHSSTNNRDQSFISGTQTNGSKRNEISLRCIRK